MSIKRITQATLIFVLLLASLAATTGSAQAHGYCGSTYRVQRGDWLARIARNCGVSLADLRAANPWTYYERFIHPGELLNIPGYSDAYDAGGDPVYPGEYYGCGPNLDGSGSYWVVCRGDTLGRIARYYGVSWRYLQLNNNIPNANRIYPGQVVRP